MTLHDVESVMYCKMARVPNYCAANKLSFNVIKTNFILHNFIHEKSHSNKYFQLGEENVHIVHWSLSNTSLAIAHLT